VSIAPIPSQQELAAGSSRLVLQQFLRLIEEGSHANDPRQKFEHITINRLLQAVEVSKKGFNKRPETFNRNFAEKFIEGFGDEAEAEKFVRALAEVLEKYRKLVQKEKPGQLHFKQGQKSLIIRGVKKLIENQDFFLPYAGMDDPPRSGSCF
jgi:hypothetical protein